jgi:hypothetical protein
MRSLLVCALALGPILGCGGDDLLLPGDGAATRIAIASGDGQEGAVGSILAESIAVLVSDATGRPVMGQPVVFASVTGEGAQLTPDTALTGADGRARAEWVLGQDPGTQTATAALALGTDDAAPSVLFSASASAGGAAALALVSGDNQTAPAGSTLPESLIVRVSDRFGNPVSGTSVTWTAFGGGSVSAAQVTTGANGRAGVRRSLGSQTGEQETRATVSGLSGSPVTFTHTATSSGGGGGGGGGDGSRVTIISGNDQSAPAGSELPEPLVIRVTDNAGRPVSGAPVAWLVTDGGGSVDPVFGVTGGDGHASTRWTLGDNRGRNRLNAVVGGIGSEEFEARATRGEDDDD